MRFIILLIVVPLFTGCTQKVWVHSSKTIAEMQKDFRECKYDSEKSSFVPYGDGRSPISAGMQEGFQSVSMMNGCLRSRGYELEDKTKHYDEKMARKKLLEEIKTAIKAEDYKKVLKISDPKIKEVPYTPEILTVRCRAYRELGNFKKAMECCNEAVKIDENNPFALNEKAITLAEVGEPGIGLELMNVAIGSNSKESSYYNNRAYMFNMISQYQKAIEDCNKSIALDSVQAAAPYKNRGIAYVGLKDYGNALKSFNKAIAIDDKYAKAYFSRGELYLSQNLTEKADEDFKKACTFNSKKACEKVSRRGNESLDSSRQTNLKKE